ncbi:Pkinase-domain-containing protein [Tothia fuscella]|uniref:non-specific serine/threonine protein kinase n=1 Tax=Tothia fuscella TaxID=1048955 RepID=A0A9P4TX89_9PEZI|nr:Pkinase-domain-containing protein [Tothia fuscella]
MSSSASTTPITRSSSHRAHQTPGESSSRPHRTQSTRVGAPPNSPHRPSPQAQRPGSSNQAPLQNVARRDFEQTNLPQQSSSRRSISRDRAAANPNQQYPIRSDSMRANTHHRQPSRTDRYASIDAAAQQQPPTNGVVADMNHPSSHDGARESTRTSSHQPARSGQPATGGRRRTTLDTSTGRWGLGKTIGAGSMGKVKLAKNLETGEQVAIKIVPRQSTDEHRNQADRERADHSKEVRTAREAAIVSLVNHPYICGMRDVVRTQHHWYMLFEYVNGGQMLDYIISHGRLKEKQARKFSRQIASALDYCHRNSIVHRDLKIENILISKTGDIKIIDFGLSNLFAPNSHLKTFCGSLYFAAPELLQAKQYTGPEVDVWSFGIVLYVLVCGKVPFDDQSMPQLHAKIKKGFVEYPPWLSAECKNLISRMLVTDPKQRASLAEIMNHTWMTKGFNNAPENFLPQREPLQLPLDIEVVHKMHGFDFGTPDYITTQLTKVLSSDEYQRAIRIAHRKHPSHTPEAERKRGVFDFYKRRNSMSRDTLTNPSNEAVLLGDDPVNAFSPLISIYFLVREKMDRERAEVNPGALTVPKTKEPLKMVDLPAPEAAYTNANAYEMAGEAPTGGRTRPRARTHGEDEVTEGLKKMNINQGDAPATPVIMTPPAEPPQRKESTAVGILRRFSTRRKPREQGSEHAPPPPQVNISSPTDGVQSPSSAPPLRKTFSVRRARPQREVPPSSASLNVTGSQAQQPELLTPPGNSESGFPKRFMSLRRTTSVDRRRLTRRGVSEGGPKHNDPPPTSGSDNSSFHAQQPTAANAASEDSVPLPRHTTSRAKSLGHARRESIQNRRLQRENAKQQENVPEETDAEVAEARADHSEDAMKPVFLKGLFSVSTTSSKPLHFIRSDIIRVLHQLNVQYSEIKGGFSCRHAPSIDLNKDTGPQSAGLNQPSHRRKISFGGLRNTDRDREEFRNNNNPNSPQTPRTPGRQGASSPTNSEISSEEDRSRRHGKARNAGETSTHVRDDVGESMALRFEIFIVKVPLLSLHGIQFKKVDGNMMHYKNMAQEILKALKL